jgi:hypothetical protein
LGGRLNFFGQQFYFFRTAKFINGQQLLKHLKKNSFYIFLSIFFAKIIIFGNQNFPNKNMYELPHFKFLNFAFDQSLYKSRKSQISLILCEI